MGEETFDWVESPVCKRLLVEDIPYERGYTPPMKMDRCQSKGVAGGAFCKRLKRKGMDDAK
jgi:hypothetical protein